MGLEFVLNELSCRDAALDIPTARQRMLGLSETMRAARPAGSRAAVISALRTEQLFLSSDLGPDYPFLKWRNDPSVELELRRYVGSLASKGPFIDDWKPELSAGSDVDFLFGGVPVRGLALALCEDQLAVSLLSSEQWDAEMIELTVDTLAGDGALASEIASVRHASRAAHLQSHLDWVATRLQEGVENGEALTDRVGALFPELEFCASALDQLRGLRSGTLFRQVMKKLRGFHEYCLNWEPGAPFRPERLGFRATLESQPTLEQYGEPRTFLCPDGEWRLFSWHARLTPDSWRLHFRPEPTRQCFVVGYIGSHLPTVDNPQ